MELNRIRVVLAEKNIRQNQLAEMVGKNKNTIARICRNESQPTLAHLFEIANALDVDVRDLLVSNKRSDE
jgi:transcriptional regulator with XRE-family HTH domain